MAHQKKAVEVDQVLLASCRSAVVEGHSAEAYEYAEVETDHVERDLVENQDHNSREGRFGMEDRFEIVGDRFGTVEDHSEIEADHFGIEADRSEMAELRYGIGEAHSGTEV